MKPELDNPVLYQWWDFFGEGNSVFGAAVGYGNPVRIEHVEDGLSKTIMISESREQEYASWCVLPDNGGVWEYGYYPPSVAENPFAGGDGHLAANQTSLNVTPYVSAIQGFYDFPQRDWGASSEHAGGVINHLFADGHVISVSETADPSMYLRMITRAGGEQVSEEALQ